ncbi:Hsp20/alpha crystallin family protein [Cytobacillus sp. FJAT-53684]|uniref:Hsp20/alpha crystallin family protein n=1 Tax=Cytobacillus mangrovibacter TaxID=3299024 RepID=A0ABW6JV23_9BACI
MNERNNNNKGKNEPIGDLMKSMNQFFQEKPVKGFLQSMDEFFKNPFPSSTSSFHVNVSETNDEHIISAELPGINKEQIQIDVLDNYVTITVLSTESMTEENEHQKTIKKQTSIKKSIRTVPLPQLINESKVKASYQNGLLQIRVPKQKGKQIMIDHLD